MKKFALLVLGGILAVAMTANAGGDCFGKGKSTSASATGGCPMMKSTSASASADGHCAKGSCAKMSQASMTDCPADSKACKDLGNCIVCGDHACAKFSAKHAGVTYHFCCSDCKKDFKHAPSKYTEKEKS
jgi:YHS domain-containing protein